MPREDVSFKTFDGVTLRGWFFTPLNSTPGKKLPCLIITHGVSCVKEMGLSDLASKFTADLPMTCLVYDHRGFGASDTAPGQPRQEVLTWIQSNDMRDAITYAQTREEVDKNKIGLWGYSLGGGEALYVAAVDRRVKAVVTLGVGISGLEILKRQAPPFAVNAMQPLFEMDRLARAEGKEPIKVPLVSNEPGVQSTLPSPESWEFFSKWLDNGSSWKNELTLDDLSSYALAMPFLESVTPTPVFFGVATRDTNSPPDMTMAWYAKLSEPKEVAFADAHHYDLMGSAREVLHPREVAFLKRTLCA